MLASRGEITEPCPVPVSLTVTTPSSRTPAFSHLRIRRMMRLSPMRCSTNRTSQSLLTESKEAFADCPSPRYPGSGDDHPSVSCLRGPRAIGYPGLPAARHFPVACYPSRRQSVTHSRTLDRLVRSGGDATRTFTGYG